MGRERREAMKSLRKGAQDGCSNVLNTASCLCSVTETQHIPSWPVSLPIYSSKEFFGTLRTLPVPD